ncbi:hypothetical protein IAT40_007376 [Kwoniella sp. CBS 6097]
MIVPVPICSLPIALHNHHSTKAAYSSSQHPIVSRSEAQLYIQNEYQLATEGETFPIYNLYSGDLVAEVQSAGPQDVEQAVINAEAAQGSWAAQSSSDRAACMLRFAKLLRQHDEPLAHLDAITMGRPQHSNTQGTLSASIWEYFAALAINIHGTSSLSSPGSFNVSVRQRFGVTAGIIPWNFPVSMFSYKAAPSVAAGNAIIIKTSEKAPLAVGFLARLVAEAGFPPPGVIQILHGKGKAGQLLSEHMKIRRLSFTGSPPTGRAILRAVADSNLKNVTLNLGGKSPPVIYDDARFANAAKTCAAGIAFNSGQVCIAASRLYVQAGVYDKFIEAFRKVRLSIHPPEVIQADTHQFKVISDYIDVGNRDGRQVCGGVVQEKQNPFKPTVSTEIPHTSRLNTDEVFGPVVVVHKFNDEAEAIKLCNDTEFGLYSAVYTDNVDKALRFAKAIESGSVAVNCNSPSAADDMPFGGWKSSGVGSENGPNGLSAWLET